MATVLVQMLDASLREDRHFAAAQFAQALHVLRIALSVAAAALRAELVTRVSGCRQEHGVVIAALIDHVRVLGVPVSWVDRPLGLGKGHLLEVILALPGSDDVFLVVLDHTGPHSMLIGSPAVRMEVTVSQLAHTVAHRVLAVIVRLTAFFFPFLPFCELFGDLLLLLC